jgi:hypothetical protein
MPEGLGYWAFAFFQFYLIGLPLASIITLIDLWSTRRSAGEARLKPAICLMLWAR